MPSSFPQTPTTKDDIQGGRVDRLREGFRVFPCNAAARLPGVLGWKRVGIVVT